MTNKELEIRLINLENAFIQSQKNIVTTVEKADSTVSLEQRTSVNENNIKINKCKIFNSNNAYGNTMLFSNNETNKT